MDRTASTRRRTYPPKIGVNVLLFDGNNILLGLRHGHGKNGMWSPPGGHLKSHERITDCAKREVYEETRLRIGNVKLGPYTNDRNTPDGRHYLSLFVTAEYRSGKISNCDPNDVREWRWFNAARLPTPLFYNIRNLLTLGTLNYLRTKGLIRSYNG
jgi:8-oxo-dGTP diphosphatase